jgi:hypothetical protein
MDKFTVADITEEFLRDKGMPKSDAAEALKSCTNRLPNVRWSAKWDEYSEIAYTMIVVMLTKPIYDWIVSNRPSAEYAAKFVA